MTLMARFKQISFTGDGRKLIPNAFNWDGATHTEIAVRGNLQGATAALQISYEAVPDTSDNDQWSTVATLDDLEVNTVYPVQLKGHLAILLSGSGSPAPDANVIAG